VRSRRAILLPVADLLENVVDGPQQNVVHAARRWGRAHQADLVHRHPVARTEQSLSGEFFDVALQSATVVEVFLVIPAASC